MPRDRELQKQRQREWYKRNKERAKEAQQQKREKLRKWFNEEILTKASCKECGENHPAVIDFHHRDPSQKEDKVSAILNRRFSKRLVLKEIEKCDSLCANCHRKLHWTEKQ